MIRRLTVFCGLLLAFSCTSETEVQEAAPVRKEAPAVITGAGIPEADLKPDRINICLSEETAAVLEKATREDGEVSPSAICRLGLEGVVKMHRLFPYAGRFEARTRAMGMHRWYEIVYGRETSVTRTAVAVASLPGVEEVELSPRIERVGQPVVVEDVPLETRASSSIYPFDDPRLPSQWHYYNDGRASMAVSGCDINVFPVWRAYTTGDPSVIVAVIDGGIDFRHEDLAANMWHNPEKSGDYKYGYNFVNNTFQITPDSHGTHVAGTIAAVNNNGIGVCGIAGGDASKGKKGVKLMSCQVFQGDRDGATSAAIKWAADHGAVIAQNSWGYVGATTTPTSLKLAVDYFIAHAGVDENGKQTGPMKGGLVIFAAGNENVAYSGNDYGPILNVAALGADFRKAYYSCYGSWVDIAAPGGDARKGNQVLSTLPGNAYGIMQGTSMACPHVSGVAALIVSRYAKTEGLTPENVAKKITSNATPIASFNPNYAVGAGLVNAYRAIAGSGGKAPSAPAALTAEAQSNNVHFSVRVPADQDDGLPTSIVLYYHTADFARISDGLMFGRFYLDGQAVGDELTGTLSGLDFNKTYYVAAAACDLAGNLSSLTPRIALTTGGNNAPILTPTGAEALTLKPHETLAAEFRITEPDGHFYTIELESGSPGIVLDTLVRDHPKVTVKGPETASGSYVARLTVTDSYGLSTHREIPVRVLDNHPPRQVEAFPDRVFSSRAAVTEELPCSRFFADEDGEELSYAVTISNETVVNLTAQDGKFFLTPMGYGYADVEVVGMDVRGETVVQTFRVLVRDGSRTVEVYPNPVREDLYFRMSEDAEIRVSVVSASGACYYDGALTVSPFLPGKVDMRSAAPGVYGVTVTASGESFNYSVVKR